MRSSPYSRIVAVVAIALVGLIHLWLARPAFTKATYEGLLFVASGVGGLLATIGVYRDRAPGWLLGALVAAGTLIGYLVSRTVGLPGLPPSRVWFSPIGVASVTSELVFLLIFVLARRRNPA